LRSTVGQKPYDGQFSVNGEMRNLSLDCLEQRSVSSSKSNFFF
jgi:hypothetical protein